MNSPSTPKEFWTTAQTASFLGIQRRRLIYLLNIKKVPGAYKVGGNKQTRWRFDPEKICSYQEMREKRKATLVGSLSVAQVADYLHVKKDTIRHLTREGKIKGYQEDDGPKSAWRYKKEDLLAYIIKLQETPE